jgi:hypothetical protein
VGTYCLELFLTGDCYAASKKESTHERCADVEELAVVGNFIEE